MSSYVGTLDWSSLATELNTEHNLNLTAEEAEEILVESDLIRTDLEFDDSYLSVGTSNDYQVGASDFTVEFWAKLDATALNTYRPFVSNQKITGSDKAGINIMERNGKVYFHLHDGTGLATLNSDDALNIGQWHHIALVRIGNNASDFKFYLDGVATTLFVDKDSLSSGIIETSSVNPMSLSYTHDGGRLTDAHMTNVRIYKRAMAQAEAAANAGSALNATPSNSDQMIFYLPLDENSGTTPKELVKNTLGSISTSGTHSWNRVKNTSSGQSKTYTLQTTSNCNYTAEGRNFNAGGYRFGFNGMEMDDEVKGVGNNYDFGARLYSSRIGRWWKLDNMSKSYQSNYVYGADNPVIFIDPDGNDDYYYDKSTNSYQVISTGLPHKFFVFGDPMAFAGGGSISFARAATDQEIGRMLLANNRMYQEALQSSSREDQIRIYGYNFRARRARSAIAVVIVPAIPAATILAAETAAALGFRGVIGIAVDEAADITAEATIGAPLPPLTPVDGAQVLLRKGAKKAINRVANAHSDVVDIIKRNAPELARKVRNTNFTNRVRNSVTKTVESSDFDGTTFQFNVFSVKTDDDFQKFTNLRGLVKSFEDEAIGAGAKKLEINALMTKEEFKKEHFEYFGFEVKEFEGGFSLTKDLTQ